MPAQITTLLKFTLTSEPHGVQPQNGCLPRENVRTVTDVEVFTLDRGDGAPTERVSVESHWCDADGRNHGPVFHSSWDGNPDAIARWRALAPR